MIELRKHKLHATGIEARLANKCLGNVPGVAYRYGALTIPADVRIVEILSLNGIKQFSPEVKAWYQAQLKVEKTKAAWLAQKDCAIDHPSEHELMPFQRVGASFLAREGRALLCDSMGLGKTAQGIVAVELSQQCSNVLILCPNNIKLLWRGEIARWSTNSHPVTVFESATRTKQQEAFVGGWAIVNYAQLRVVCKGYLEETKAPRGWRVQGAHQLREQSRYFGTTWDWLLIDEGHYLKSHRTQIYAAVQALQFRKLVIITGTPMGNDSSELWALLHLLDPKRYSSYWRFYELYVDYVEDFFGKREILGVRHPQILRRELASRMVRRTKKQVYPQLPDKRYQLVPLRMQEAQSRLYRNMAQKLYIELEGGEKLRARNVISKFTRLRQILSTPVAFGLPDTSCKLDYVLELLQATKERVVVFSLYRATIQALHGRLETAKITHVCRIGGQSATAAHEVVTTFVEKRARVFVSTLDAGGTGTDLRKADASIVVFVDRHYNPIRQEQAEDRVHGIGQTRKVHIYSLHCPGTIDGVVQQILERKTAMSNTVLARSLLEELLRYLKEGE